MWVLGFRGESPCSFRIPQLPLEVCPAPSHGEMEKGKAMGWEGPRRCAWGAPGASPSCFSCVLAELTTEAVICVSLQTSKNEVTLAGRRRSCQDGLAWTWPTAMSRAVLLRDRWCGQPAHERYPEPLDFLLPATHPCQALQSWSWLP